MSIQDGFATTVAMNAYVFVAPDVGALVPDLQTGLVYRVRRPGLGSDALVAISVEPLEGGGLVNSSPLPPIAGAALTSGTAYWVYLGRTNRIITANFVEFHVSAGGTGGQTAEVALCSSPTPPSRAGLSLTKLAATGTVDALTGTGVMRNTADLATVIPANTNLWAGIRTAMASTQPSIAGLTLDMAQGRVQSTAGAGALTAAGPFAGAIIAAALTWQAPDLRLICT